MTTLKIIRSLLLFTTTAAVYLAPVSRATAQPGGTSCNGTSIYKGRCVDVAVMANEPVAYAECDKVKTTPSELRACHLGVAEAKTMAMNFGSGHGRMLGFDRGFAAGMYDAEQRAADDPVAVLAGERVADQMGRYMENGLRAAGERGQTQGTQDGVQAAHTLFEQAVGNGQSGHLPVKRIGVIPAPAYAGDDDGYHHLVPQDGEYANLDVRQTLDRMDNDYARYHNAYDQVNGSNRPYVGDFTRLSLRDLWFDDGVYPFDTRKWVDASTAWRAWSTQAGIPRRSYDSLGHGPPVDLQTMFQRSFADAYPYYANYYYSAALYAGLDEGYRQGIVVGTELGRRMARSRGMVQRFNVAFKARTAGAFADAYQQGYPSAFNAEFDVYQSHPVLSIQVTEVIGGIVDGVLEPGEPFKLRLRIVNSGGLATAISGTPSGTMDQPAPFEETIGALTSREYITGVVGRIGPRLRAGEQASIRMTVNGTAATPLSVALHRAVQLAPAAVAVDAAAGSGSIEVTLRDGATVRTGGDIVATLTLDGRESRHTATALNPGESQTLRFGFSEQDPLRLIVGGVGAHVKVQAGDVVMDEQDVRVIAASSNESLVRYFATLVQPVGQKGFVPPGVDPAQRLAEITARITTVNQIEVRGARTNVWKEMPGSTIVGLVQGELLSMAHNTASAAAFHDLGTRLWAERTDLGRFLFFNSAKRNAYEAIVKDILRGKP